MQNSVKKALEAIRAGEFVVVLDDEDRENEGDLIIAAEKVRGGFHSFSPPHSLLRALATC